MGGAPQVGIKKEPGSPGTLLADFMANPAKWQEHARDAEFSMEQMERECSLFTIINTNSPLKLDVPMMEGIIQMSSMGQIVIVTPFTLSGAMAPVTVAGALVLQNAEALAGIAFTQMVRKGAPVGYGGFTSNVDMKSGAPAFGTPEYMKAQLVGGQLARRYKLPYRTSNTCAANTVDAQAAYESVFSIWGAIQGGGNFMMHGAGWLEGGLRCSYEKMILDIDLLQMVAEFLTPLDLSEDALAVEAAHLMEQYKINALVVVDDEKHVVGALNIHDLLRARVV